MLELEQEDFRLRCLLKGEAKNEQTFPIIDDMISEDALREMRGIFWSHGKYAQTIQDKSEQNSTTDLLRFPLPMKENSFENLKVYKNFELSQNIKDQYDQALLYENIPPPSYKHIDSSLTQLLRFVIL